MGSSFRVPRLVVAVTLSSGMTSLPIAALALALPAIHRQFDTSLDELQWMLNAYTLAYATLLIAAGRAGDVFGRRRVFLTGVAIYGGASVAAALAQGSLWLILAMAGIGVGAALVTPTSLALIASSLSGAARSRALALWGGGSALVAALAPAIGGLFTDQLDWRWIFWLNAAVAVAVAGIALSTRETPARESTQLDVRAAFVLGGALLLLAIGLIEGGDFAWSSPATVALFMGAVLLLAGFAAIERRAANPLIDFGFFGLRNYLGPVVVVFAVNFALSSRDFFLPLYFQDILNFSPLETGLLFLPTSAALLLLLPAGGALVARIGPRIPMLAGLAVIALGLGLLARLSTSTPYRELVAPLVLIGGGLGLTLTPRNVAAMGAVPKDRTGQAAGILSSVTAIASILGVAVSGTLFEEVRRRRLPHLLAAHGPQLSHDAVLHLEGSPGGTPAAHQELARFGAAAPRVAAAAREAFAYSIAATVVLSTVVVVVGLALVAAVMRRRIEPVPEMSTTA